MKQRQKTMYKLSFFSVSNQLLEGFEGDLLHCVEYAGLRLLEMDSYHKVRRCILKVGGAYTNFFHLIDQESPKLIRVCIVSRALYNQERQSRFLPADFQRLSQTYKS
jgi:hypothetical protein